MHQNESGLVEFIGKEFEIEADGHVDEDELTRLLADQIAHLLEARLEFLLSLMYRMDVAEDKVQAALAPESELPANVALAKLVIARQKKRLFTKRQYGNQSGRSWEDDL